MDLRHLVDEPTADEVTAVDRVLGPPTSGWEGGVFEDTDGRVAYGGHDLRQRRHELLPALHALQEARGWVSPGGLGYVCRRLGVPPAEAYGVATFYAMFATEERPTRVVHVCDDIVCADRGEALASRLADDGQTVVSSPCLGRCEMAPVALVQQTGGPPTAFEAAPPPTVHQDPSQLELLRRVGVVDPSSLTDYEASGGLAALRRARELGADAVLDELERSGLRGRGGAAFPIGAKWRAVRDAPGDLKHVVANGDESEPGTFKDRVLMEGDPFAVVEALAIAALVTGAARGYLYVRGEYPEAVGAIRHAVDVLAAAGHLDHVDLEVRVGAGAYICGEETALFASIEGHRGEPRQKPPFPTTNGLFDRPTAVNNIETLAAVLQVLEVGGEAFAAVGTENSTGTKLFAVSGAVARPGVYEVPFGTTLDALIDLAGGAVGGIGAVLLGGAAGVFVGPDAVDLPLSVEDAAAAGATLGSGAVVVFDAATDFGPVVRRIAAFFRDESCGQCVPCRVGTVRQEEALVRLGAGRPLGSTDTERALLADIDAVMTDASICGLGRTAASAVRSALALDLPGVAP